MVKSLTHQIQYANSTVDTYGKDTTGNITYTFNSAGFRNESEYDSTPDIVFAGGSIGFGVGVDVSNRYSSYIANQLSLCSWDLTYAQEYYNNRIIYNTVAGLTINATTPIVIQWVSDQRSTKEDVNTLIEQLNNKFINCLHIYIDSDIPTDQNKFMLINPIWIDYSTTVSHPGPKTHLGIAKFIIKKLHERKLFT